jgi:hypothetical protein
VSPACKPESGPITDAGLPAAFEPAAPPPPHPGLELAEVLADAVGEGIICSSDAQLIAASRIAATPLREIALRSGAKLRTLQWRRQRAEAALVILDGLQARLDSP